jgi:hypothetical protein
VVTSDTTKAAARGVSLDHFLSAEAPALMADLFSGSQGIPHHASDVIAVHPEAAVHLDPKEQDDPRKRIRPGCVRMWTRLLRSRGGGESPLAFPYEWDRALGRLDPREPTPLRQPPERDAAGQHTRHGGGTSAPARDQAPRLDPDAHYRLHKRGARFRSGQDDGGEDAGTAFTRLAKEAVQREGRPDPHPGRRWWDDVVLSGREAARVMEVLQLQHERVGS